MSTNQPATKRDKGGQDPKSKDDEKKPAQGKTRPAKGTKQ